VIDPPDAHRTIETMALTVPQIEARLSEIDGLMSSGMYEYALAAHAKIVAVRERELKIAQAFAKVEGTPTERRQLAIAEVGPFGFDAEARYARLAAEMEVLHGRSMIGASLLKSAKAGGDDPRYHE
jgi:hypothetical protein